VGSGGVVHDPPVLDHGLRLEQAREHLVGEGLVAGAAAEGLDELVLPRRPRLDVERRRTTRPAPVADGVQRSSPGRCPSRCARGEPRRGASRSSTATTSSAPIVCSTRIHWASRVCSSTTCSNFSILPSVVVSNWTSRAHTSPVVAPVLRCALRGSIVSERSRWCRVRHRLRRLLPDPAAGAMFLVVAAALALDHVFIGSHYLAISPPEPWWASPRRDTSSPIRYARWSRRRPNHQSAVVKLCGKACASQADRRWMGRRTYLKSC